MHPVSNIVPARIKYGTHAVSTEEQSSWAKVDPRTGLSLAHIAGRGLRNAPYHDVDVAARCLLAILDGWVPEELLTFLELAPPISYIQAVDARNIASLPCDIEYRLQAFFVS